MGVSTTESKKIYSGSDTTTVWPLTFPVLAESHLQVITTDEDGVETVLVQDTDYSVSGVPSVGSNYGSITYPLEGITRPTGAWSLTLNRVVPLTQETDFSNQGGFYPEDHTEKADLLVMGLQQVQEQLDRCYKVDLTSEVTPDGLTEDLNTAVSSAEASATSAGAAKTAAELAEVGAVAAQGLTEDARDDALDAQVAAEAAQALAEAARDAASAASGNGTPTGTMMMWLTNTAPTAFLLCDGSAVNRETYSALFAVIGTTYGAGDGSTTFNLPDLKGKIPVGYNSSETEFDTLGETGGEKTHTLTEAEMPAHTHTVPQGNAEGGGVYLAPNSSSVGSTVTSSSRGSGSAHNNLQPYIVVNYIIKYTATADPSIIDTDDTLAADSDTAVPSQKAIKSYVDSMVGSFEDISDQCTQHGWSSSTIHCLAKKIGDMAFIIFRISGASDNADHYIGLPAAWAIKTGSPAAWGSALGVGVQSLCFIDPTWPRSIYLRKSDKTNFSDSGEVAIQGTIFYQLAA